MVSRMHLNVCKCVSTTSSLLHYLFKENEMSHVVPIMTYTKKCLKKLQYVYTKSSLGGDNIVDAYGFYIFVFSENLRDFLFSDTYASKCCWAFLRDFTSKGNSCAKGLARNAKFLLVYSDSGISQSTV